MHSCSKQWAKWLPLAEYWYNTSHHSALQLTPFEVLYGHPPGHFGITNLQTDLIPDLETWLTERNLLTQLIQQQLVRAQQRMKSQADKQRTERVFSRGFSISEVAAIHSELCGFQKQSKTVIQVLWTIPNHQAYWQGCLQAAVTGALSYSSCGTCFSVKATCSSKYSGQC